MRDIENDRQWENTKHKLALIDAHIAKAMEKGPHTPEKLESIESLGQTAKQLREEVIRYEMKRKRIPQQA